MNKVIRHKELGDFLRTRREHLTPQEAGLKPGSATRRTPGLRREEVAALSGVSLAWYTYLEQGRPINVSSQVLESLARVLRLDRKERDYVYIMAGQLVPSETVINSEEIRSIPEHVQAIFSEINHFPAYIVDSRLTIITWNRLASCIFGPFDHLDTMEKNLIWRMFTQENYRQLFIHWENVARSLLAQFRGFYGKYPDDPYLNALIEKLIKNSDTFKLWWLEHDVDAISDGHKELNHPLLGRLAFNYTGLLPADRQEFVLTVFTPLPGTGTKEKLDQLL